MPLPFFMILHKDTITDIMSVLKSQKQIATIPVATKKKKRVIMKNKKSKDG